MAGLIRWSGQTDVPCPRCGLWYEITEDIEGALEMGYDGVCCKCWNCGNTFFLVQHLPKDDVELNIEPLPSDKSPSEPGNQAT